MHTSSDEYKRNQLELLKQNLVRQRQYHKHNKENNFNHLNRQQPIYSNTAIQKNIIQYNSSINNDNSIPQNSKTTIFTSSRHIRTDRANLSSQQVSSIINRLSQTQVIDNSDKQHEHSTTASKLHQHRIATYDSELGLDDDSNNTDNANTNIDNNNSSSESSELQTTTNNNEHSNTYIPSEKLTLTDTKTGQNNDVATTERTTTLDIDTEQTQSVPSIDLLQPLSPTYNDVLNETKQSVVANDNTSNETIEQTKSKIHHITSNINYCSAYRESIEPYECNITCFVGTWNLHAKPSPINLYDFIQPDYDLYIIGTQECENTIEQSILFNSKVKWCTILTTLLGHDYIEITQSNLVAIHCIVYIHKNYAHYISNIEVDTVATGIGNVVGNKGCVGISFNIGYSKLCCITSHFQAHQNNIQGRNLDYYKIINKIRLGLNNNNNNSKHDSNNNNNNITTSSLSTTVIDRFDYVLWCGDLNYRVHANRSIADALLDKNMIEVMLANDQLTHERLKGRVFQNMCENDIHFKPTYKYDSNSDLYDTSKKQRVPSWTDRILYKPSDGIKCNIYDAVQTIKTSDHRPVYANFTIRVTVKQKEQDTSKQDELNNLNTQNNSATCVIQ